jgi:methyl-accepting chemotaxis protein
MSRVTDTAAQVKTKIALLQTSCEGQERTVSQMRVAINELGTGAQETAAVAEESSAAGACLTEQAVGLRGIVQLLQV